jgi:ubiquinone/menaquinone biosynthesis C-methylase UbiE
MSDHHVCPWWLAYTFDNPLRRLIHNPITIFDELVQPGMTVMDVGCGMGYFSIGMAKIIGDSGKVIAVDLQQQMLDIMQKRAARQGVEHRIESYLGEADTVSINDRIDFILAFWVIHEFPNPTAFFKKAASILKPKGKLLYSEPAFHVSAIKFNEILSVAQDNRFNIIKDLSISFSRAILLYA